MDGHSSTYTVVDSCRATPRLVRGLLLEAAAGHEWLNECKANPLHQASEGVGRVMRTRWLQVDSYERAFFLLSPVLDFTAKC